jgi:thioredoxin 1
MKKIILPFLALAFLVFSCNNQSVTEGKSVDAKRFAAISDSLQNEQIVDVRTPEEFSTEHIANAINIDWKGTDFATEASKLDKNKPVMVYCLSGQRSSEAADWFKKNGFVSVYQLDHGLLGWKAEHLPLAEQTITVGTTESTNPVSIESFNTMISTNTIVLVDFSATWCGPCQRLAPRLDELVNDMGDKFKLVKLDADRDSELANSMNITALPTLLLYKSGKLIWRNEGLIDKSEIADKITAAYKN